MVDPYRHVCGSVLTGDIYSMTKQEFRDICKEQDISCSTDVWPFNSGYLYSGIGMNLYRFKLKKLTKEDLIQAIVVLKAERKDKLMKMINS